MTTLHMSVRPALGKIRGGDAESAQYKSCTPQRVLPPYRKPVL